MATLALKRRTPSLGTLTSTPLSISVVDNPLPTTAITGKPASQAASFYHTCRSVLDKLASVKGMAEHLNSDNHKSFKDDPLGQLWSICRRGVPLCILFNALCPEKPLKVDFDPKLNQINTCKATVYYFIVACLNQLEFPEEDVFTITDLYQSDTNGFVKVVNTINKILDRLEARGVISAPSYNQSSGLQGPKDTRCKVVDELLETERKYVHDLETLQNYMRELQNQKILSLDTIHYLFGNLNALVDFQRRFLICLEGIAEKTPAEQRFGQLFVQMEAAFAVYEPYCANYYSAQTLVVQEAPKLQQLANVLNPIYELPSMLIKPVQRICKYPLLLSELIKTTDKDCPHRFELEQGLEAIKRVAENVNETQRKHENGQALDQLKQRIDSWKGKPIDSFGNLLLHDKLQISSGEADQEYTVFFFEKALLFCQEKNSHKRRLTKPNAISIKKKRSGSFQRKGQIFTRQITGLQNVSKGGSWVLSIQWESPEMDSVMLKFRHEEQLRLWQTILNKTYSAQTWATPNPTFTPPSTLAAHALQLDSTSFLYDEDDDEEDDSCYEMDDDDHSLIMTRSISTSRLRMTPTKSTEGYKPSNDTSMLSGRPMPGMNLQPLPRSKSTLNFSVSPSPPIDYGLYPLSPPPSYPSSPTSSSRISTGSSGSSPWQYHSAASLSPLPDTLAQQVALGMPTPRDEMCQFSLPIGRSQSQSVVVVRPQPTTRHRSQSNPGIRKYIPMWDSLPQVPSSPKHIITKEVIYGRGMRTTTSTPHLSNSATSFAQCTSMERTCSTVPLSPGKIKVKLNYNDGIYAILVAINTSFTELMESVEKKIRLITGASQQTVFRLKYQDEDGDYITINSDDDIQIAFESRRPGDTIDLFVNI